MSHTVTNLQLPERYEPQSELGRGGMGVVWRVLDHQFNRPLAVKVMLPHTVANSEAVARFEREAELTGTLQHPAIPPVVDRGLSSQGSPYFSMKLIQGETLSDLLKARGSVQDDLPRFLGVFEQMCQAVGYAHSLDIIHRDLKPSNVMVGAFGEVQVMDWGMAKRISDSEGSTTRSPVPWTPDSDVFDPELDTYISGGEPDGTAVTEIDAEHATLTKAGQVLGTLPYMPPEQAMGEPNILDARADVFSLGGTLCKILTDQPPFTGKSYLILFRKVGTCDLKEAFAALDNCGADAELISLCKRCLSEEPENRPANGSEIAEAIRQYQETTRQRLEQERTERAAAETRAKEERKRRKVILLAAGLAVALLCALSVGGWWYQKEETAKAKRDAAEETRIAQEQAERKVRDDRARNTILEALEQAPELRKQYQFDAAETLLTQAEGRLVAVIDSKSLADQLRQSQRDLLVVRKLDQIRLDKTALVNNDIDWNHGGGTDGPYAQTYRSYGLDILAGDPQELGRMIQTSAVTTELIDGLDDWRLNEEQELADRILDVIRYADENTLRNQLRDPVYLKENLDTLQVQYGTDGAMFSPVFVLTLVAELASLGEELKLSQLLHQAVFYYPSDFWLHFEMSQLPEKLPGERVAHLQSALAVRPNTMVIRYNLGGVYERADRLQEAERSYRMALQLDDKFYAIHHGLGTVLARLGRREESVQFLKRATELNAKSKSSYSSMGYVFMEMERWKEAEQSYLSALKIDPDYADALNELGLLYNNTQRPEEAVPLLEKAIELVPDASVPYRNLSLARIQLGQYREAVTVLQRMVELNFQSAEIYSLLGGCYLELKEPKNAETALQAAVNMDPLDLESVTVLGELLREQRRMTELEAHYTKSLQHPGATPEFQGQIYSWVGYSLNEDQQYERGEACCRAGIELSPNNPYLYQNLGFSLRGQKRFFEAMVQLQQAHKLAGEVAGQREFLKAEIEKTQQMMIRPATPPSPRKPLVAPRP